MLTPSFYSANKENMKRNSVEGKVLRERISAWLYSHYCTPHLKILGIKIFGFISLKCIPPAMSSEVFLDGAKDYFDFFKVNIKLTSISRVCLFFFFQ